MYVAVPQRKHTSTSGMLGVLVTYGSIFMLIKIVQFIGYTKYEDMYA